MYRRVWEKSIVKEHVVYDVMEIFTVTKNRVVDRFGWLISQIDGLLIYCTAQYLEQHLPGMETKTQLPKARCL